MTSETTNIYQEIYDEDMKGNGVPAFKSTEAPSDIMDEEVGYVLVNESTVSERVSGRDLFDRVSIPNDKQDSYDKAVALFDNYNLIASERDEITLEEQAEVEALIQFVKDRPVMVLARQHIVESSSGDPPMTDAEWYDRIKEVWFRSFREGESPTRSGFEHVFLGEKKKGDGIGGLHWWYYYHKKSNEITYDGAMYKSVSEGFAVPEIATMEFVWDVDGGTITKPIGGFFVGLSVEGLMAMGMVRSSLKRTKEAIVLQGAKLNLVMFNKGFSIKTFYPEFVGLASGGGSDGGGVDDDQEEGDSGAFRLVSALVNPTGADRGNEKVTMLNVSGSDEGANSLNGWRVIGPNGTYLEFGNAAIIGVGEARTFTIPARGSLQLSNKGGSITVKDPSGGTVQVIQYSRDAAKIQGNVLLWDGNEQLLSIG